MKLTKIRKIEGDLAALKSDLIMALKVEEKEVTINQLTRQILVKVGPYSSLGKVEWAVANWKAGT